MQVATRYANGKTITFIVADSEKEADYLKAIAPLNIPLVAVLEPNDVYLFPYLKIVYEGVME